MASQRILISCRSLTAQFSRASLRQSEGTSARWIQPSQPASVQARFFASGDDKDKEKMDDPFGIHFNDGSDGLGTELPKMYKRDTTTGHFTGEVVSELSDKDKRVLAADDAEHDAMLLESMKEKWEETDESGNSKELNALGERIRTTQMATTVIGRSVQAQAAAETLDDGSTLGRDESKFSQHLTKDEFTAFSQYVRKTKNGATVDEDDIPVQENNSGSSYSGNRSSSAPDADDDNSDNAQLSLKWLTSRAQRQMDDSLDDNPYSDLMPGDLSPNRLVNRKRAKQIPIKLLHHNNIELLRHFITPTGQIRNRVQTRLGARDQRRVSKLIKRARAMGLLPYQGQFKHETHGWVHAEDIHKNREWEEELEKRGLVVEKEPKSAAQEQKV